MRRTILAAAAALGLLALTACDDGQPPAQYAPDLPPAAGYRAEGGDLLIWTGTPCRDITRITLRLDSGETDSERLVLEAETPGPLSPRVSPRRTWCVG